MNSIIIGTMNLGGSLTRQIESDSIVSETSPHIANIGKMVEVRQIINLINDQLIFHICIHICYIGHGE